MHNKFLAGNLVVCCALVLAAAPLARGENAQPSKPRSLAECIQIAMTNQVDIVSGRNDVNAARGRAQQAASAYFPQLSIQNNAFTFGSESVLNRSTTGTALNVTQNLFDGGLREATRTGARYGVTQSRSRLSRTTQTVVFDVTKAYYDTLRAGRLAEVAESNVKYNEELRQQVQTRAELGDVAKVDLLPVEAQLANARVSLLAANNDLRTARLNLQDAMGASPQPDFDIVDVQETPAVEVHPLNGYVTAAAAARPDVLESEAGAGAARASAKAARFSIYPRPVISGQYQRQISGGFTTSGGQVVGGIVFDIFSGGANRAAYREAQANQANAEVQEKQLLKDIQIQVEEAYLNLTSSKERLDASALSLAAAQKNYENQKERYNEGLAITLDLLNAELQVVTARTNDVQARYDYLTAIAQLDYAVGKQGDSDAS